MKQRLISSVFILLFCFINTYAQQTAYESKISEITQKYFSICYYGYNKPLTLSEKANLQIYTDEDEAREFILGLGILNYAMKHTDTEVKNLLAQMDKELKIAEKLKTSTDFQREKEKEVLKKQAEYELTNAGTIKKNIKTVFEMWNNKGEFEKQQDYEERLQKQSQNEFIQTCIEQIKNKINNYTDNDLIKILQPYNADNEFFSITFNINGIECQDKLNVPISDAERFKKNWSSLRSKTSDYDWCFVNNALCPTVITLSDGTNNYRLILPWQNSMEIAYSFDDFGIENKCLKGFVFKYSIAKEKFIQDSLEIISYNNKLEKIWQDLNVKLLTNHYNIDKTIIPNYQKVSAGKGAEDYYNSSLNSLTNSYEKITNELEINFNKAYLNEVKIFPTKEEFELYYSKGENTLQAEITKRKILDYLNSNFQFIESMDFSKDKTESIGSSAGKKLLGAAIGTNIPEKDYTNENELRKDILSVINDSRNEPYYLQILDFVFATNQDLNREWIKNGQYFNNKAELYDAFISGNYKQILKNKK
jgi:hypothetical protein